MQESPQKVNFRYLRHNELALARAIARNKEIIIRKILRKHIYIERERELKKTPKGMFCKHSALFSLSF